MAAWARANTQAATGRTTVKMRRSTLGSRASRAVNRPDQHRENTSAWVLFQGRQAARV